MELDSIEDATSSIVSTIKAFKEYTNEVEAASHATDVFNAVGNTEAVSSKDLGEILKRSASAMAVAGNSLNETAALGAAGNTIVQDSAMLGTALKTLSLRLTSTKVKLEEIGEETEYAAETTSDYRDKVLALTATTSKPVDILGSDGQYKNTYNILKDISEVWKEMNSMEQSAMLKMLFGVRQTNVGAAILTNFDIAERALKTAENASEGIGSAMEEHNRWADSLEARINDVNSSIQVLSTDVFSTDGIKEFVSSVNDLVQAIDWVVKKFDVVKIAFGAFASWMLNTKNIIGATVTETGSKINLFGHQWSIFTNSATQANQVMELQVSTASSITKTLQMYNSALGQSSRLNTQLATTIPTTTMQQYLVSLNGAEASMQGYVTWLAQSSVVTENANMVITRYKSITSLGADAQAIFRSEVARTNPTMAQYLATTNAASMSQKNYQSYLRKTELQTKAATLATQALNVAMSLGVTAIITGVIQWIGNLADKYNDLLQKSSELRTELETQVGTLTNLRKQYEELMTSTVDEKTRNERLTEIKKALVEQYGFEEDKIRKINQLRAEGLELIDEEIARQRQDTIGKTENVFNKALGQVSNARTSYSIVDTFGELGVKVKNLRPEIKGLFEEVEGGIAGTDFQLNADNPLEFKRKLEEVRSELIDVRTETGKFNKDEQNLFDNISYILDELYADPDSKVPLIGGIINWASDFMPSEKDFEEVEKGLELRAKAVYDAYVKRVRKTFEEASGTVDYASWLEGLYQQTKDVYGDEYFTYYKTAFDDMFKSIRLSFNDNIVPASDDFDAIEALVLKAKQGLSELDGTADKAAKSLDELDKVMKDNKDADKFFSAKDIVELLDKYPELADAIEKTEYGYKLNERALEELKKKQLEEKKATLQAELDKSRIVLREAKRRLEAKKAEYEAITEAERNFIGPVRGDQLNKVKLYGDYNRSVKQLQDAEKTVSKIQMQIDVLDPDFKDIADSTADTKANLDDARKSLDKMKDDMDDAKKYVEDLLKLTMDMIKKNKELEKTGLKEQLENYKKLISKQKELIDLKKEERDFNKDLADQNRDLLAIQQELEALSIEGANYSLEDMKRKAELQQKYNEQEQKRTDFLYNHEVDVRKDALDKEQESFEDQINTQIKSIEDYLDKEGVIREDAMKLINEKTEQFYDDLKNYTLTYTDMGEYSFNKLWTKAYEAMAKYGNGQIDIAYTLAYLDSQIAQTEAQIKSLEASANAASNSTKNALNATRETVQQLNHDLAETNNLMQGIAGGVAFSPSFIGPLPQNGYYDKNQAFKGILNGDFSMQDYMKYLNKLPKFHDGGVVGGNGEVLAKLMSGEVVSTQKQAETFLSKTLPNLINSGTKVVNNKSASSSFTLGDLVINGNADMQTVNGLRRLKDEIADAIFKRINSQVLTFNGGRIK